MNNNFLIDKPRNYIGNVYHHFIIIRQMYSYLILQIISATQFCLKLISIGLEELKI